MIQVYTGNGKGKTTAALGLALRVSGAGQKVYICQFLKGRCCCESFSLEKLKNVKFEQFGRINFVKGLPRDEDKRLANAALNSARRAIKSKKYALVILDELNVALNLKLIKLADVIDLIRKTPKKVEVVLTGRLAHPNVLKLADLVSEIKDMKHYHKVGLKARRGIEF